MASRRSNPLGELIAFAVRNAIEWKKFTSKSLSGRNSWLRLPVTAQIATLPKYRGKPVYPTVELAGTAGLYLWLLQRSHEVLFANDLAYTIHGIDAIALDTRRKTFLICAE